MRFSKELINISKKSLLGTGGYSEVYKIFSPEHGPMAVKVINMKELSEKELKNIKFEILIQKNFSH